MSDMVEINGTLNTPYLQAAQEGSPWLGLEILDAAGERLGYCGAQVTGSPLPFRAHIERKALADDSLLTLKAYCLAFVGSQSRLAEASTTLTLADATAAPVDLQLEASEGFETSSGLHPIEMRVITLSGRVNIPAEVVKDTNKLDATLLVVQEDGASNRWSSNLAEHSLKITGNKAAFTLFVDADSVPEGRSLRLHLGLYNHEGTEVYAGRNFKELDLGNLPDLSDITLKLPPR